MSSRAPDESPRTGGWGRRVRPDRLKPVATLNRVDQSFHEARRWSTVDDNIVVEGDGQVEQIGGSTRSSTTAGLRAMPPMISRRDCPGRCQAPAAATTGHP